MRVKGNMNLTAMLQASQAVTTHWKGPTGVSSKEDCEIDESAGMC